MDTSKVRNRSKVLESIALHNKIIKNINGIKKDLELLKKVFEKIFDICQEHDTRQYLE